MYPRSMSCCGLMVHIHIHVALLLLVYPRINLVSAILGSGDGDQFLGNCDDNLNNLTKTLDRIVLSSNYDKTLRPGIGGPPVHVVADIYALSIGPIQEVDMEYHLDVFFRQRWNDYRLAYKDPYNILSLNTVMLESIWYPDTYFINGKKSYGHNITTPNRLFRIYPNGDVLYTQRLTIIPECKMHFENYPMDRQVCPLLFGSNSYSTSDITYSWHPDEVIVSPNTRLAQFQLNGNTVGNFTIPSERIGNRSVLYAHFFLQRNIGYFLIQIYVPCILVTMSSWVTFWLNPEATPARVALGVLTILAITTLGWSMKDNLPKVSYAKAMDWYLALCFTFALGSLVEFAAVNFFSKSHTIDEAGTLSSYDEEDETQFRRSSRYKRQTKYGNSYRATRITSDEVFEDSEPFEDESCCVAFIHCLKGNAKYKQFTLNRKCQFIDVGEIDRACRIVFPVAFAILNLFYWLIYLSAGGVQHVHNETEAALIREWS